MSVCLRTRVRERRFVRGSSRTSFRSPPGGQKRHVCNLPGGESRPSSPRASFGGLSGSSPSRGLAPHLRDDFRIIIYTQTTTNQYDDFRPSAHRVSCQVLLSRPLSSTRLDLLDVLQECLCRFSRR